MTEPKIGDVFQVGDEKYIRIQAVTGMHLYYMLSNCIFALRLSDYAVVIMPPAEYCDASTGSGDSLAISMPRRCYNCGDWFTTDDDNARYCDKCTVFK